MPCAGRPEGRWTVQGVGRSVWRLRQTDLILWRQRSSRAMRVHSTAGLRVAKDGFGGGVDAEGGGYEVEAGREGREGNAGKEAVALETRPDRCGGPG